MRNYINRGNYGFEESRNGEYVDKSGIIAFVNKKLKTKEKFFCVTRARRFGKTTTAEMLCAYYDESCDSEHLFKDLAIATDPSLNGSYKVHLNKYPTIYVDMTRFVSRKTEFGHDIVKKAEAEIAKDIIESYPDLSIEKTSSLCDTLLAIYNAKGEPFFFIIDEWDAILRECQGDSLVITQWIDLLRGLFKDTTVSKVFAGVYITGILPIIKCDTQSALNNFKEYNMIQPKGLQEYFGFTDEEVRVLCEKHGMDFCEMKRWYDGYTIGRMCSVFNPNSVMEAISSGEYANYWTSTGAVEELIPYLKMDLQEEVRTLMSGGRVFVNTSTFSNKLSDIGTRDKVLTALIHLGYLSYSEGQAFIPNMELKLNFADNVKEAQYGRLSSSLAISERLLDSILKSDTSEVEKIIGTTHSEVIDSLEYNSEQGLYTTLLFSMYYAQKYYVFHREYPTGNGYADLVLIPISGQSRPGIIMELKYGKSADEALSQIKSRNYCHKVFDYTDNVILVGINYDKKSKLHQCAIETVSRRDASV